MKGGIKYILSCEREMNILVGFNIFNDLIYSRHLLPHLILT